MISTLFTLFGGIGLFLLGMVLLSDGLKAFAGDALRLALLRFTGRPTRAFVSGALATALVQSSSATTVTMIGFVSAGLLTFSQAVGVILGASLGTTSTGWIVSTLGLKVSVGSYALPLVGIGAFTKVMAPGKWRSLGSAVAGFGLIFVGISTLQSAMEGLSSSLPLADLPSTGLLGRIAAVAIGVVMTVVLQSSSAAVAMTLTALHTASIQFEQAALLVIGASIGTTVTGALAAIGATVSAKRTALALMLFNTATGLIAMLLLPALLWMIRTAQERGGLEAGAMSLAAFHTTFIGVGVAVFLPISHRFAGWVERILPDREPALTARLDDSVLSVPAIAIEAVRRSLRETASELFDAVRDSLLDRPEKVGEDARRARIEQALRQSQEFFARIPVSADDERLSEFRLALLHALDHMVRLRGYLRPPGNITRLLAHPRLRPAVAECREVLALAAAGLQGKAGHDWLELLETSARRLAESNRSQRPELLRETASGQWQPLDALDVLDAVRWLSTIARRTWRIGHYLSSATLPEAAQDEQAEDWREEAAGS